MLKLNVERFNKPVNKVIGLLVLTFLIVSIKTFYESKQTTFYPTKQQFEEGAQTHVLNKGQTYNLSIKPSIAHQDKLLLSVDIYPSVTIFIKQGNNKPEQIELNNRSNRCVPGNQKELQCSILIKNNTEPSSITFYANQNLTQITSIHFKRLTVTHISSLAHVNYELIFLILVAPIPLLWLLHGRRKISQWLIISIAFVCLSLIQPYFTLILIGFLFLIFRYATTFKKNKTPQFHFVWYGFFASIALLIFGKNFPRIGYAIFPQIGNTNLAVPLGISYVVIRIVDTLLSIHRGSLHAISFREFLCFVLFPPTIPAGPIETLEGFQSNRLEKITSGDIAYGIGRISIGLFKKIVIAQFLVSNALSSYFYQISSHTASNDPVITVKFLTFSFLYAYIDFSAYSDIAIGGSRLYGYKMIENFTWPIIAENLHSFWRSWHRSLSLWCFRNVYFPLSITTRNIYIPLYVTMAIVGLWHTFGIPWFSWSLYHATGLTALTWLQRKKFISPSNKLWFIYAKPLRIVLTMTFVIAGYSFVVFNDFKTGMSLFINYWKSIFIIGVLLCKKVVLILHLLLFLN